MNTDIMRSPIFYMGNKHKLLKQLLPLFPNKCRIFLDAFGGSGVVSMNYQGYEKTIYNEINENVIGLVNMIKDNDLQELNDYYQNKIKIYNLRTKSNKSNPQLNAEGFYKLRDEYNNSGNINYKDLFLLLCYSMNHLLRFNSNNQFNASNGSDSYNHKNYIQLQNFKTKFENILVLNEDVFNIDFSVFNTEDFIYFDPPYTNTTAVYNEKRAFGGWNKENDLLLFDLLENLNIRGIKWGLSNVFINRGVENNHLIEWCEQNNWNVYHLNRNYNPFSRGNSNNDEVFITNY